jgi:hypothetical protein
MIGMTEAQKKDAIGDTEDEKDKTKSFPPDDRTDPSSIFPIRRFASVSGKR